MPVSVLAFRTGAFAGDITLTAENLPARRHLPAGHDVRQYEPAPRSCSPRTKSAAGVAERDPRRRHGGGCRRLAAAGLARGAVRDGGVGYHGCRPRNPLARAWRRQLVLAVTGGEAEPIAVRPAEEKVWENSVAGRDRGAAEAHAPARLRRRGEPQAAGSAPQPSSTSPRFAIPAGTDDGKLTIDVGGLALPPGSYCCYLQATTSAPYDRYPSNSTPPTPPRPPPTRRPPELAAAVQKATEAVNAAKAEKVAEKVAAAEKALAEANEKVKQNEAAKAALAAQIKALQPKETRGLRLFDTRSTSRSRPRRSRSPSPRPPRRSSPAASSRCPSRSPACTASPTPSS